MSIIHDAKIFAIEAHGDQKRKYTNEPYINHPMAVAALITAVGAPSKVIAAALLHDVVEDTDATIVQIRREFGTMIGDLVWEVTDVSRPHHGKRKVRKEMDRQHVAKASPWGQTIKLADLIDNGNNIALRDPHFAPIYMAEKRALLKVLTKGDQQLFWIASAIVNGYYDQPN